MAKTLDGLLLDCEQSLFFPPESVKNEVLEYVDERQLVPIAAPPLILKTCSLLILEGKEGLLAASGIRNQCSVITWIVER